MSALGFSRFAGKSNDDEVACLVPRGGGAIRAARQLVLPEPKLGSSPFSNLNAYIEDFCIVRGVMLCNLSKPFEVVAALHVPSIVHLFRGVRKGYAFLSDSQYIHTFRVTGIIAGAGPSENWTNVEVDDNFSSE